MTAELKTAMDFVKAYDQDRGAFLEDMEAACIAFAKHHCEEQGEVDAPPFSEYIKSRPNDLDKAGDFYEALPENSKSVIDFAIAHYMKWLSKKYINNIK